MNLPAQRWLWLILLGATATGLTIAAYYYTPDLMSLFELRDQLAQQFSTHPIWFCAVFFLVFTAITALCLPGASVLMVLGGMLMDLTLCVVLSNSASALGATLTMWASRKWLVRDDTQPSHPIFSRLIGVVENNQWSVLLGFRFAPAIPFAVFNVLCGFTQIRTSTFFLTSFVGMLPGTILYINAGYQASGIRGMGELMNYEMALSIAALGLLPLLAQGLFRKLTMSDKT